VLGKDRSYFVKHHSDSTKKFSETDIYNMLKFLIDNVFVMVCLARIKEQVGEKRSTVCTHRYADCLLKNMSTKHNKYVVNQKLEHVVDTGASQEKRKEASPILLFHVPLCR
jgi:ribosomal protein S24E